MRSGGKPRRRAPTQSPEASAAAAAPRAETPAAEETQDRVLERATEGKTAEPAPAREATAGPVPDQAAGPESTPEAEPEPEATPDQQLPSFDEAELLIRVPTELLAAPPGEQTAAGRKQPIAIDPRQVELARFARLHLRTGLLIQARAELEELAGSEALDRDGQLDLAEIRWRTGDLAGAGIAAEAYLLAGGSKMLGYLIAAEVASERGRLADARELLGRAISRGASNLQTLFAGVPSRAEWPDSVWLAPFHPFEGSAVPSLTAVIEELEKPAVAPAEPPAEPEPDLIEGFEVEALEPAAIEPEAEAAQVVEVEAAEPATPETVEAAAEIEPAEPGSLEEAVEAEEPVEGLSIETFEAEALEPEAIEPEIQPVEAEIVPIAEAQDAGSEAFATRPVEPVPVPLVRPAAVESAPLEPVAANAWDEEIAAANSALTANDALLAALHFAVALRMSPSAAQTVLDGIGDRDDLSLQLVRLDAQKAAGNRQGADQTLAGLTARLDTERPAARRLKAKGRKQEPEPSPVEPDADLDPEPDPKPAPGQTPIRWE